MKKQNLRSKQPHAGSHPARNNPTHNIFTVTGILVVVIALFNFNLLNSSYTEIKTVQNEIAGLEYSHQIARTIEQLSYPRQSRGFIYVSPSKGQKRDAPEGAGSHA